MVGPGLNHSSEVSMIKNMEITSVCSTAKSGVNRSRNE